MDKKKTVIWRAVFFGLLIAPAVFGMIAGKKGREVSYENCREENFPILTAENYERFPDEVEKYYNQNLPLRNQLIAWNSLFVYKAFGESVSPDVIIGKDGWLFYQKQEDGNPIMGYKGLNCFSQEHLQRIGQKLKNSEDYLAEKDCEFVLFIVPDKERVYSEYMPDDFGKLAERYRVQELTRYLEENTDVRVVYPLDELMEYKTKHPDQPLYYHYDTHWNDLGAYIGACAMLEELGVAMPAPDQLELTKTNYSEYDLADLLNLRNFMNDDVNFTVEGYAEQQPEVLDYDDMTKLRFREEGADERKIMVVRDSFTNEMAPYIAAEFEESVMPHRNSDFKNETQAVMIREEKPDILVYEISERYLDELLGFELPYDENI